MYEIFIGLEIHIHLLTESKVFCRCPNRFGDEPNTNVCPVCLGHPGVLPVLNKQAMLYSYRVGKALNCELSQYSLFDRKNYFYPDMTKNYQITQFHHPVGLGGWVDYETADGLRRSCIHDIHLEEDAGKMIHREGKSFLDYNRAGTSLLEIVTDPDMKKPEDAERFLQNFRKMVRYLGVCDGNMEEGSLRCDANISINLPGQGLGRKVEIKNLNSSRHVRKALEFEFKRQSRLMKTGGEIVMETRLWNEAKGKTESMRSKEEAHDYRYFPEPDIPPFVPDEAFFKSVDEGMTELPLKRKQRYMDTYQLSDEQAEYVCEERARADFYDRVVGKGTDPSLAATWIRGDVARGLNKRGLNLDASPLTSTRLAGLLEMLSSRKIHQEIARKLLEGILDQDKDPEILLEESGLDKAPDTGELESLVEKVLEQNPQGVEQIRGGDPKPRGFLVGQVMKASKGSADPRLVQDLLSRKLLQNEK